MLGSPRGCEKRVRQPSSSNLTPSHYLMSLRIKNSQSMDFIFESEVSLCLKRGMVSISQVKRDLTLFTQVKRALPLFFNVSKDFCRVINVQSTVQPRKPYCFHTPKSSAVADILFTGVDLGGNWRSTTSDAGVPSFQPQYRLSPPRVYVLIHSPSLIHSLIHILLLPTPLSFLYTQSCILESAKLSLSCLSDEVHN